jgi:hypothetical protein
MQGFGEEYAFWNKKEDCLPNMSDLATCPAFPVPLRKRLGEKIQNIRVLKRFFATFLSARAHEKSSRRVSSP